MATIDGSSGDDRLTGTNSADRISGSDGIDELFGEGGDDRLFGGWDADTLNGGLGDDQLDGENGDDTILGGAGDDVLLSSWGNDVLDGESGIDAAALTFGYYSPALRFTFSGNATYDTGLGTKTLRNIERVDLNGSRHGDEVTGGVFDDYLFGAGGDDRLSGGAGKDTIDGEEGVDTLSGGDGDDYIRSESQGGAPNDRLVDGGSGHDFAYIDRSASRTAITVNLSDPGSSAGGTVVRNVEAISIRTGSGDDRLTGGRYSDQFFAAAGDNVLKGLGGNDFLDGSGTLYGGAGDDTLAIGSGAGIADGGDGIDNLWIHSETALRLDLSDATADQRAGGVRVRNVELLQVNGSRFSDAVTGGAYGDRFYGHDGDDHFEGAGGDDYIEGGMGSDTASYASAESAVAIDLGERRAQDSRGAGLDTLREIENVTGSSHTDHLTGTNGANRIDGGLGRDVLIGHGGNDVYVVSEARDRVVETSSTGGADLILSSVSWVLGEFFENLQLEGDQAISGTGNGLANVITGNGAANYLAGGDGNDRLDGGSGADAMQGGAGNDVYQVDDIGDRAFEKPGAGLDTIVASVSYGLRSDFENLVLTGPGNLDAVGNALRNALTGNGGANLLDGRGGADRMAGGTGDDRYIVDHAGDQVIEDIRTGGADMVASGVSYSLTEHVEDLALTGSAATDGTGNALANVIAGNSAANNLLGLAGEDSLSGGGGDDRLDGGVGRDTLTGGAGADVFVFDSAPGGTYADSLLDFESGEDRILLDPATFKWIDSGETIAPAAFHLGRSAQIPEHRILYDQASGHLFYDVDGSGKYAPTLFARLTPGAELSATDIVIGA